MTLTTRQRWLAYAAAALLTGVAMAWVDRRDEAASGALPVVLPVALPVARSGPAAAPRAGAMDNPDSLPGSAERLVALAERTVTPPTSDPFETAATVAASMAAAGASTSRPMPIAAAPAPALPAMPFTFLGRWTERGQTTVYLQRDNRSVSVRGVGKLDDEYSVESIDDQGIVFNYLPLGQLQALRFDARPADASPAARPGSVAAATEAPAPAEGDN